MPAATASLDADAIDAALPRAQLLGASTLGYIDALSSSFPFNGHRCGSLDNREEHSLADTDRDNVITNEVVPYAHGDWAAFPRARGPAKIVPSLREVRQQDGGPGVSDDELLLHIATDVGSIDALKTACRICHAYNGEVGPLVDLIHRVLSYKSARHVQMQAEDFSIVLRRN